VNAGINVGNKLPYGLLYSDLYVLFVSAKMHLKSRAIHKEIDFWR
jgi:hypothetical protein